MIDSVPRSTINHSLALGVSEVDKFKLVNIVGDKVSFNEGEYLLFTKKNVKFDFIKLTPVPTINNWIRAMFTTLYVIKSGWAIKLQTPKQNSINLG